MQLKKFQRAVSLFMLSFLLAASVPIEGLAVSIGNRTSDVVSIVDDGSEIEENSNGSKSNDLSSTDTVQVVDGNFTEAIKTGESQNANDSPIVEVKEVPDNLKQFFIGVEDLHSLDSYSVQKELADQSEKWQALKTTNSLLRSSNLQLSENGRINANVARYTPEGLWYTHDIIIRWQIDGEDVFCIQEGVFTEAGINYEARADLTAVQGSNSFRMSLIGYFGYYSQRSMENYALTQLMIWDELGGSFINYGTFGEARYTSFKNTINSEISNYSSRPSWHNTTVQVKAGETVRISDTTNRFNSWSGEVRANTAGVKVEKSGNDLLITATADSNFNGAIQLNKHSSGESGVGTAYAYTHGAAQDLARLYLYDPLSAHLNIEVLKEGHAQLKKVDGTTGLPLAGAVFRFTTDDEQTKELTTNAEGIAEWRDLLVDTKVTIEEITAPNGYVINSTPQTLTIRATETTTVTFDNQAQVGQLELLKTVETAIAATEQESDFGPFTTIDFEQKNGKGFEFKIRPTEDIVTGDGTLRYEAGKFLQADGEDIVWTTDEEGRFTTEPILHIGKYEIVEVGAPKGVVLLEEPLAFEIEYAGQTVDITSAALEVENFLQEINIYGQKQQETIVDWEEGQAVIELENANNGQVFALRLAESLTIGEEELPADTTLGYSVVEDGVIRFENLRLPNQVIPMYLQEIEAGADHVLDDTKHTFVYDPENNEISFDINVVASQPVADEDSETEEDNADTEESENIDTEGELEDVKATTESTEEGTNEPDSDSETEVEEESVSEAIINRLARANVKVIKTDGMDSKPLEGVEFDLIRIDEVKDVELEEDTTDNETVESEDTEEQDVIEAASETKETTESDDSTTEGSETEDTDTDGTETEDSDIQDPGTEEDQENVSEVRTVVGTYTTNAEGEILVENLPTGKYVLVETKPLDWYHENDEEYTFEVTPENDGETVEFEVTNNRLDLEIETLFAEVETGSKVVDPTIDVSLVDYAWIHGGKEGHEYFVVTQYINVATQEVVDEDVSSFISTGEDEQEILFGLTIPANTMKDGDELVATHMVYSDEDRENLVNDHFDLENKEQTVSFEAPDEEVAEKEVPNTPETSTPSIPQAGSYNAWEEFKAVTSEFFASIFK